VRTTRSAMCILATMAIGVWAARAAPSAMVTECNLVTYYEDGVLKMNCPSTSCGDEGTCGAKGALQPGGGIRAHCACSDGSQAACNTQVTVNGQGQVTNIQCLNPCAESCDQIPAITEVPQTACFCDN
jgi:hypothetical protein